MNNSRLNSKQSLNKTYSLSRSRSRKSARIKENSETNNDGNLILNSKDEYDGLTDIDEKKNETKFFKEENENMTENSVKFSNYNERMSNITSKNVSEIESSSINSYSSRDSNYYESNDTSDDIIEKSFFYDEKKIPNFDVRDLKPMETLSWLKDHGLNRMANLISKEREDFETKRVREETLLGLYDSNIKQFDAGYLKKLFVLSLDKSKSRIDFEENSENPLKKKESKVFYNDERLKVSDFENSSPSPSYESNVDSLKKKYIKPRLINRLEVSEESISGENALAFQKYIRDLQEEVKMKDEKLRLREMERDNARLTRDQLTRAVKSSLEIGNGAGKLDFVIKEVIRRNLSYAFRLLYYKSKLKLRNRIGSEIFAGASLIKQLMMKRLKFAFERLNKNAIKKKDGIFWKKDIVNNEEVASNIISTFKNILPCYKLACIVQHNHISALKKFLYIWTKCSNLKNNDNNDNLEKIGIYHKIGNKITLSELKIAAEIYSKQFPNKEKKILEKKKKGFFSEDNIKKIGNSGSLFSNQNSNSKEILKNIDEKLSSIPIERLDYLTMLINKNQEQRNIDIARDVALTHLSDVIRSVCGAEMNEEYKNSTLNKIGEINNYKEKLISSFENLIFNKDKLDIINEIKNHANDKFKQPIPIPEWIKEKHSKLLEDFYSNPFYSVFVNEYNKLLCSNNDSSIYQKDNEMNYFDTESSVNDTDNESEIYLFDCNYNLEKPQLNIERLESNNVNIEPEFHPQLEVVKTDDLYICDDSELFETIYYYDDSYIQDNNVEENKNQFYDTQYIDNLQYEEQFSSNQELFNEDLANHELSKKGLLNKNLTHTNLFDEESANESLIDSDLENTYQLEPDLADQSLVDENTVNQDLMNEEITNKDSTNEELVNEDLTGRYLVDESLTSEDSADKNSINKMSSNKNSVNENLTVGNSKEKFIMSSTDENLAVNRVQLDIENEDENIDYLENSEYNDNNNRKITEEIHISDSTNLGNEPEYF